MSTLNIGINILLSIKAIQRSLIHYVAYKYITIAN